MAKTAGMNNATLKRRNRGLVLQLIATGACESRIEIAKAIGLSKMAVSNIVSEYMEQGIIREEKRIEVRGIGRNPVSLTISPNAPKIIGLYVFREECAALLCDLQLNILQEHHIELTEENADQLDQVLYDAIDAVMPTGEQVMGIGIGSIGPIDLRKQMLLTPPNFFGIHDFPIADLLKERYQLPVYLDSQYNCAALAERYYGAASGYRDFIFLGISNGIGSGILSEGEILRNNSGFTSELGHMSIDWRGNLCSCGNRGCLETYAGARVMERKLAEATGEQKSFAEFCRMAELEENSLLDTCFEEMIEALSCALISSVNAFNPEAVIIGHEGVFLPKKYMKKLETMLNDRKLVKDAGHIPVLKSAFGAGTQEIGCACIVLEHVFQGEFV